MNEAANGTIAGSPVILRADIHALRNFVCFAVRVCAGNVQRFEFFTAEKCRLSNFHDHVPSYE